MVTLAGLSNTRVQAYFARHASDYDRQFSQVEQRLLGQHRGWATAHATGLVIEVGVGTGLNLPLYPAAVRHVLGLDLSAAMIEHARARIERLGLGGWADARPGDAQRLDLPGASFDTVVSTYTLCTIPEPLAALREARRVLRPGGRLVLVEHGPASVAWVRLGQRLLNPCAVRWQADHLLRDPLPLVRQAGFQVDEADRAGWAGLVYRVAARKPPDT